ncbi:MAG TPA: DUF4440 domain-containing protein [Hyphomonas sp.]|jgi:hypothetical protein|uniref:YybH family protein n=1 Tax=uncultured Hyphomonas sp. TaxID=225298 RepID=UPI000C448690|nr:DUF4440 domain-containing protein [Hyphomonas sp.]MAN91701.1 DUF4440 domain-containing protein [Hyphomonadaceae bacterium]HBL93713.1 DUF4440 domain-containing protein [Hyphomonas sp.]HCJ18867.1 DUF4440 domain-containing protein [Hyphomonas sp.]|tara:strand:+ start:28887 stop:29348 length:462 start_codon:yes stop_codon:yes gene_type:complete
MKPFILATALITIATGHAMASPADDAQIRDIIADIERGWETGDGAPFREHLLNFEEARYFESGGENTGLDDLVDHHVTPEKDAIPDLDLSFENIQINYEADFAWALADTAITGTLAKTGEHLDRTGKQTILLRRVDGVWKVVHTHSSSRAARK